MGNEVASHLNKINRLMYYLINKSIKLIILSLKHPRVEFRLERIETVLIYNYSADKIIGDSPKFVCFIAKRTIFYKRIPIKLTIT